MASKKKHSTSGQKKPRLNLLRFLFSIFLIIFGFSLIYIAVFNRGNFNFTKTSISAPESINRTNPSGKPIQIQIASINKTLEVSEGEFTNGRWKVATTGVSYYTQSALPGSTGNAVFYGHNWKSLLGDLNKVKVGDFVEITIADGSKVKYQITETKEVKPSNIEILKGADKAQITIYTCSGFLDQARFVVIGELVAGSR